MSASVQTSMGLKIPRLETDRLIMREWHECDVDAVAEIYGNDLTAQFVGGVEERNQVWRRVATFIGHWQLRGFGLWAVERKDNGETIGWTGIWEPQGWPEAEIGYGFTAKNHGFGFATEAASAVLKYAYEVLGWKTVISLIDAKNVGSQGVAKRLGAEIETKNAEIAGFKADIWRHVSPENFKERFA